MKAHTSIVFLIALLGMGCAQKADTTRYSQQMINARMTSWHNKDATVGFANTNSTNGITEPTEYATWDYVPGVVAKGILDVWEYYQDSAWADAWYKGLSAWALTKEATDEPGILDDLNCTKVFVGLYNGAKPGGKFENAEHAAYFMEQMHRGAKGLEEHKHLYSIAEGGAAGGWMHKATDDPTKSYWGQMWCDGAYMGPALLAQLLAAGACDGTDLGWNDVYTQFTASWPYLWDAEKQLPYHILCTNVVINTNARVLYEAGHLYPCSSDSAIYHSEEYWGRAAGWYILALVDVLEAMEQSAVSRQYAAEYETLCGYLTQLADGLVARQDPETGCWYQLLAYDSTKCATQGVDETGSAKYTNVAEGCTQCNYLESSASCLITAALLKGTRLGYISHAGAGKKGYEGIIRQFVRTDNHQSPITNHQSVITITSSCQSAGLSKDRNGSAAYYLIGKDVPIQDNTEGKVLGAFLMAAVEYERLMLDNIY